MFTVHVILTNKLNFALCIPTQFHWMKSVKIWYRIMTEKLNCDCNLYHFNQSHFINLILMKLWPSRTRECTLNHHPDRYIAHARWPSTHISKNNVSIIAIVWLEKRLKFELRIKQAKSQSVVTCVLLNIVTSIIYVYDCRVNCLLKRAFRGP